MDVLRSGMGKCSKKVHALSKATQVLFSASRQEFVKKVV